MKFKRLIALNLIFVMLLSLFIIDTTQVYADGTQYLTEKDYSDVEYIFIGDSRTMQFAYVIEGSATLNWDLKGGGSCSGGFIGRGKKNKNRVYMGYSSLNINSAKEDIIANLKKLADNKLDKNKVKIYYLMGVNGGQTEDNIAFVKENIVGQGYKNVFYSDVLYGNEATAKKNGMGINNNNIKEWNKKIKENASSGGYTHIECAETLGDLTQDGVHLGTNSEKWMDVLLKASPSSDSGSPTGGKTIANDGKPRQNPFGDSGCEPSFSDCKYFDFFNPYNATFEDIGGYAIDFYNDYSKYNWDGIEIKPEKIVGNQFNVEFSDASALSGTGLKAAKSCTWKLDEDLGWYYTEINGARFYMAAIGMGIFNNTATTDDSFWKDGMPNTANDGLVCDAIFTDGTVIHILGGDCFGGAHALQQGTCTYKGQTGWTHNPDESRPQDGMCYRMADLKYPCYQDCYYGSGPYQSFEVTGSASTISSKLNMKITKDSSGTNNLAYIRIYNMKFTDTDAIKPIKGREGIWTVDINTGSGTGDTPVDDGEPGANPAIYFNGTYYKELDLMSYNKLDEVNIQEEFLNKAQFENLSDEDVHSLSNWQNQTQFDEEKPIVKTFRIIVMIIGILLTLWAILIYIAFWLDRFNNFIDIDFLPLLTLNKLRASESDETCSYGSKETADSAVRTVNHRTVIKIAVIMLGTGALMITGVIYKLIFWIINFIVGVFKK